MCSDGACSGNPGPGGWGTVLFQMTRCAELSGGQAQTTNNRMELTAVIQALAVLPDSVSVKIMTDSQYVQKGMEQWLAGWKKKVGKPLQISPSKIKSCGSSSTACVKGKKLRGPGFEVMQGILETSVPIPLPEKKLREL